MKERDMVRQKSEEETKMIHMSLDEAKNLLAKKQKESEKKRDKYAVYTKVKAHATLMEEMNDDKIIVFPSVDAPWYKIGGKSALFYAYDVAIRACAKKSLPAVKPDTDNMHRFRDGVVFIKDIDKMIARLAKIGITEHEVLKDGIYVFQLPHAYSDAEIKGFRETKYRKGDELNDMVAAKRVYPEMRGIINRLIKTVFPKSKKLPGLYQECLGIPMLKALTDMNFAYFELANGRGELKEHFKTIVMGCNDILATLIMISEIDAWSPVDLIQVGELATDLKMAVMKAIKKNEKARKDA